VHTGSLDESKQKSDISSPISSPAKHGKDSSARSVRPESPHLKHAGGFSEQINKENFETNLINPPC
jgi:hypothetical protein